MTDIRGLQAALDLGVVSPRELWDEMQRLSNPAPERWYVGECRNCGEDFWTRQEPTGTKWTQLCTSCLYDEV